MGDWHTGWEALAKAIGAGQGVSSGSVTDMGHLTVDQQLKVAEVAALLSISQELNNIHHNGINPDFRAAD